jgi:hypothetical protein
MVISVYQPKATGSLVEFGPSRATGLTAVYDMNTSLDPFGRLTWEALNDWTWGGDKKLQWDQATGSTMHCSTTRVSHIRMTLECHQNESNPLLDDYGYFGITYDFYIDFWFYEYGAIEYLVQGQHDGFPNYEIYVGNQRLYEHDAVAHGQTLLSLGPPTEYMGLFYPGWIQ